MTERIGVYVCKCGPNISEALDVEELVKYASTLGNVALSKSHNLLCSEEGKEFIKKDIKEKGLTRIVIAACSPKEHENTFMKVCSEAGLNPYLLQIANIREQCAWVTTDKNSATKKAKILLRAAIKRVVIQEPLVKKEIEAQPDVLVIGAGIAGIESALTLAQKKRKVYLVEKLPSIGGRVARYEDVFPNLECATCMLDPKLDEVLHMENIEVLTYSEVEEVLGFYGNFIVKVKKKARLVDLKNCIGCAACITSCPVQVKNEFSEGLNNRGAIYIPYAGALPNVAVIDKNNCLHFKKEKCEACKAACGFGAIDFQTEDEVIEIKVGAIVVATGFDVFDCKKAPQFGYGKFSEVYNSLEFERLLSSTGPTEGKLLCKNGKPPKSVALIHCVGSRSKDYNEYCSGVCCMYSLKFAHLIKKKLPQAEIFEIYTDFCLPGKGYQQFYNRLSGKDVKFIRVNSADKIRVSEQKNQLVVKYEEIQNKAKELNVDMIVLASAIESNKDASKIAGLLSIPLGKDGFFMEEHGKLNPVATTTEGIFIAGCAQGPKDIQNAVAQGEAAAGKVLSSLIPGEKLQLEAIVTEIDENLCGGCKICISLCPYKAIRFDKEKNISIVNELLCKGCGTCAAACPSGAGNSKHFNAKQILAEIKEVAK